MWFLRLRCWLRCSFERTIVLITAFNFVHFYACQIDGAYYTLWSGFTVIVDCAVNSNRYVVVILYFFLRVISSHDNTWNIKNLKRDCGRRLWVIVYIAYDKDALMRIDVNNRWFLFYVVIKQLALCEIMQSKIIDYR